MVFDEPAPEVINDPRGEQRRKWVETGSQQHADRYLQPV